MELTPWDADVVRSASVVARGDDVQLLKLPERAARRLLDDRGGELRYFLLGLVQDRGSLRRAEATGGGGGAASGAAHRSPPARSIGFHAGRVPFASMPSSVAFLGGTAVGLPIGLPFGALI